MKRRISKIGLLAIILFVIGIAIHGSTLRAAESDGWEYEVLEDGTAKLVGHYMADHVVIPETIDGYTVTKLYTKITSSVETDIVIPDSITLIGDRAFIDCTNLESVTMPKKINVIHDYAFGSYADKEGEWGTTTQFVMKGYKNTAAELYCTNKGIKFKSLGTTKMLDTPKLTKKTTKSGIAFTWKKVKGATSYVVYQYESDTKEYKEVSTISATSKKTYTYSTNSVKKGKTYKYKVRAYTYRDTEETWYYMNYASTAASISVKAK